jgi:subtilisin family serine protease
MASGIHFILCLMLLHYTVDATFPPIAPDNNQRSNDWLVAYKPGTEGKATKRFLKEKGATVKQTLRVAGYDVDVVELPSGFATNGAGSPSNPGRGPPPAVLQELLGKFTSEVQYVEPDGVMTIAVPSVDGGDIATTASDVGTKVADVVTTGFQASAIQSGLGTALWGLDRIDQVNLPLSTTYSYNDTAGQGVTVYVLDTGILTTHAQFAGRSIPVQSYITIKQKGRTVTDLTDGNGHGTHCAGTVGGLTTGVAKKVSLVAVKVLSDSGSGSNSGIISGVNYVRTQCPAGSGRKCIISMSLGGGFSQAVNDAVNAADTAGILVVVAAGNDGNTFNACSGSPAGATGAFTVGATTITDAIATYSSNGACVDILAPGSSIYSAWYNSNSAYNTISGTSMATPHVAGLAALYWADGSYTVADLKAKLVATATPSIITGNVGTSSNRLARYQQM